MDEVVGCVQLLQLAQRVEGRNVIYLVVAYV